MSQYLNEKGIQATLMTYAVEKLANWAREDATSVLQKIKQDGAAELNLKSYLALLQGQNLAQEKEGGFINLLSCLVPPKEKKAKEIKPKFLTARPLNVELVALFGSDDKGESLWVNFTKELAQLPDNEWRFEAFTNLFYKYAWAVPCTYGEIGVSLYEEFKAMSALVYASGLSAEPAEQFLLVGGDLSGIQKFIYTVTHKAAARGLRGRSFFLQLLSDAIVRAILQRLALPWTNAVYTAGGNFLILASKDEETEKHLERLPSHFNDVLRTATEGDLRVAIGWAAIDREAVGEPETWRKGFKEMSTARRNAKKQPFAKVAHNQWKDIFGPMDEGGERYCVICHRGLKSGQGKPLKGEADNSELACTLCYSFSELAQAINHEQLWMVVKPDVKPEGEGGGWSQVLTQLSEYRYEIVNDEKRLSASEQAVVYAFNRTDFLAAKAQGFRLLANVTSRMTDNDVIWARENQISYQDEPQTGHIRDLDVMARDAEGVKWVGVLRMDVDNLGAVISQWQPARALAGTSALSSAMDFFFNGRLNELMRDEATVKKQGETRLAAYIIYAGGDDLFIVGAWDKLVRLAERIQAEFREYTNNPNLTISAGISLMDRPKFPLASAAREAKKALDDKAKAGRWELTQENGSIFEKPNDSKNAICFLDTVVGWDQERWGKVTELQRLLANLLKSDNEKVPRGLIQLIRNIHAQYEAGRKEYEKLQRRQGKTVEEIRNYPMFHGRWMWLVAYQLKRMGRRYPDLSGTFDEIHQLILKPEITPYSGLAARWAEYLTRMKGENNG